MEKFLKQDTFQLGKFFSFKGEVFFWIFGMFIL